MPQPAPMNTMLLRDPIGGIERDRRNGPVQVDRVALVQTASAGARCVVRPRLVRT